MRRLKILFINGTSMEVQTKHFHETDSKIRIEIPNGRDRVFAPWYIVSSKPI